MAATGQQILELAEKHVGERYIFGTLVPKNNPNWRGPWDCAEFASWLVYQVSDNLYGCNNDHGNPAIADAWTGFWDRDARGPGITISIEQASRTPGAAVLRHSPQSGHIVISDGKGGTVEAASHLTGVIRGGIANRRWDRGVLVPGIAYTENKASNGPPAPPQVVIYHLTHPLMTGDAVKQVQQALKAAGFDPGAIDSSYGPMTYAAVHAYQLAHHLLADGEVGPETAKSLGVTLPKA
jgi:N-acetylmuramoyl-L-alanine amidase